MIELCLLILAVKFLYELLEYMQVSLVPLKRNRKRRVYKQKSAAVQRLELEQVYTQVLARKSAEQLLCAAQTEKTPKPELIALQEQVLLPLLGAQPEKITIKYPERQEHIVNLVGTARQAVPAAQRRKARCRKIA